MTSIIQGIVIVKRKGSYVIEDDRRLTNYRILLESLQTDGQTSHIEGRKLRHSV